MTTAAERPHVAQLREQLAQILAPAKSQYNLLAEKIEEKQAELTEMRLEQAEIRKLIRAVEPDFEKREHIDRNGAPKGKRRTADKYSEAKVEDLLAWLRTHAETLNDGDGFYASEAAEMPRCPVNQSGLSAILVRLHERGQVRLTKKSGQGGRKYFKVVV